MNSIPFSVTTTFGILVTFYNFIKEKEERISRILSSFPLRLDYHPWYIYVPKFKHPPVSEKYILNCNFPKTSPAFNILKRSKTSNILRPFFDSDKNVLLKTL